ncbi:MULTISPECIES: hypothetical protein [Klebsiella]|uniref:hypothetical protein n=1 Tax=Klebsiella TaxID=570 RepID=UPI000B9E4F82|nr:hypothetical protein [Klebsiella pneumoniae]AWJ10643.1 hypothetical protein DEO52_15160 [Klebsiella pneumoniae]AWJ21528.1 hypothetical protein DEO55_13225 [Klebsiella pneumoniae]MBF2784998.1 hypothetical protein [Klebsiella pneumoniae]MBK2969685.1 hypothetical protein [Klebsiella pneumoniae]MBK2974744.1 hypothetical protein [Klebsiella pneumoniae]
MPFVKKIVTDKRVSFPLLQLVLPSESSEVEITVTVTGISGLSEATGVAEYMVEVYGTQGSILRTEFPYSGAGNPIEEAESYLKNII